MRIVLHLHAIPSDNRNATDLVFGTMMARKGNKVLGRIKIKTLKCARRGPFHTAVAECALARIALKVFSGIIICVETELVVEVRAQLRLEV